MLELDAKAIEFLLGRPPWVLPIDQDLLARALGPHVLITGAGGSIAGALIDQLLELPDLVITAVDQAESGLFALRQRHPRASSRLQVKLLHLSEKEDLRRHLETLHPHTVFHAAAHKHVALAEENVCAVIRNNLTQTRQLQQLSHAGGVRNFVVVSTDKAVAPIGVMGASKRLCEWALLQSDLEPKPLILRLPNVLASQGSVLEIFAAAQDRGVAYPISSVDMTRQFISLAEARNFLLAALAANFRGLYCLENQNPCHIVALAQRFHKLSSAAETVFSTRDIGIAAGEKISEQMHESSEAPQATSLAHLLRLEGNATKVDFDALDRLAKAGDDAAMRGALIKLGFELCGTKP